MTAVAFPAGGYRYIPGVFQYSAGVAADPGFQIDRVTFRRPVPLREGFDRIAAHLRAEGRPLAAFCACELRSPEPMSEALFRAFNKLYVGVLSDWGIVADGRNPVARSNVCPELDKPSEPSFHAFSFAVPADGAAPTFVVAGSGEVPEGKDNYRDHIVRPGDTSPGGLRAKADYVLGEMERRLASLGHGWADTTAVQVYTVHDLHPFLGDAIVARGAAPLGLTWQFCRPPVAGLDYEMDCRAIAVERVV
jgi:hypothetical protein